jgi:hypothetical protein
MIAFGAAKAVAETAAKIKAKNDSFIKNSFAI